MQRISQVCCQLSMQINNHIASRLACTHFLQTENFPHHVFRQRLKHTASGVTDEGTQSTPQFSGYIPVEELEFSYSRSSGAGGQHVNKVNTKVEMRFHVPSAKWMTEDIKTKLIEMEKNRITKEGYLVLTSERTRKQILNQADVMDKLRSMVFRAAVKPRELTEEEIQLRDRRLQKAKDRTLREKRHNSMKKQSRGSQL